MNQDEIEADLRKLQSFDPEQTKWVVWPLDKLLWIYKQLFKTDTCYQGKVRRIDTSEGEENSMRWIEEEFSLFLSANVVEEKEYLVEFKQPTTVSQMLAKNKTRDTVK
jgi:hypothetical protein